MKLFIYFLWETQSCWFAIKCVGEEKEFTELDYSSITGDLFHYYLIYNIYSTLTSFARRSVPCTSYKSFVMPVPLSLLF